MRGGGVSRPVAAVALAVTLLAAATAALAVTLRPESSFDALAPVDMAFVEEKVEAQGGFNWGESCSAGTGAFNAPIALKQTTLVGTIPVDKTGVEVRLSSPKDIDIQLTYTGADGKVVEIVAWPNGLLNGARNACINHEGVRYCYSGYNGGGTVSTTGNEWITIEGVTNKELTMKAYGYDAGSAAVTYKWDKPVCCCTPAISGTFTTVVPESAINVVGDIPVGKNDVDITLNAPSDADVQLADVGVTPEVLIIAWPKGLLNGNTYACTTYKNVEYCYSGYNGVNGIVGRERIQIKGETNTKLQMRVFGYKASAAEVTYSSSQPACCQAAEKFTLQPNLDKIRTEHHTEAYAEYYENAVFGQMKVVVRRGGFIYMSGKTSVLPKSIQSLRFYFAGSELYFIASPAAADATKLYWTVTGTSGENTLLRFNVPVVAEIGIYDFRVRLPTETTDTFIGNVAIIFNAWHPDDAVYMSSETDRNEYLVRDNGRVWWGDASNGDSGITSSAWNYQQYRILPIIFDVLKHPSATSLRRSDPVSVARHLSWLLNSAGNSRGVLAGRWDGYFADGFPPTHWTGSMDIFQQWSDSGRSPVKYGQCWVFSGITTSAGRALGIPTRSVTNFRSAHDVYPYDWVIDLESSDSVWNFHVWNEVWIKRTDLNLATPHWNAIDATPQERSDNMYQMGPASLLQAKRRERSANFDTAFLIGEVDADVWKGQGAFGVGSVGPMDNLDVGRSISTIKPGCFGDGNSCRLDVTDLYKPTTANGRGFLELSSSIATDPLTLTFEPANPKIGDTVKLIATLRNISSALPSQNVNVTLRAVMIYEDGSVENLPQGGKCTESRPAPKCGCPTEHKDFCETRTYHCCCWKHPQHSTSFVRPSRNQNARVWDVVRTDTVVSVTPTYYSLLQTEYGVDPAEYGVAHTEYSAKTEYGSDSEYGGPYQAVVKEGADAVPPAPDTDMHFEKVLPTEKEYQANTAPEYAHLVIEYQSVPVDYQGEEYQYQVPVVPVEYGVKVEGHSDLSRFQAIQQVKTADGAQWTLELTPQQYANAIWKSTSIRFIAEVESVSESGQRFRALDLPVPSSAFAYSSKKDFTLAPVLLNVTASCTRVQVGEPVQLTASFLNPVPVTLTHINMSVDGTDVDQEIEYDPSTVPALGLAQVLSQPIVFTKPGRRVVALGIDSCQVRMIRGDVTIDVYEATERVDPEQICTVNYEVPSNATAASANATAANTSSTASNATHASIAVGEPTGTTTSKPAEPAATESKPASEAPVETKPATETPTETKPVESPSSTEAANSLNPPVRPEK